MTTAAESLDFMFDGNGEEERNNPLLPYIQALQRWKVWQENVPAFYSSCVNASTEWPSLTVQLYPHVTRDPLTPGLLRHAVLYGDRQGYDDVSVVVLASAAVDEADEHARLPRRAPVESTQNFIEAATFSHPAGDVDRVRYCPARPELAAVKCAGAALSVYDIGPALRWLDMAPAREGEGDRAAAGSQRAREAGREGEEEGGSGGGEGDGGGPASTMQSSAQEDASLEWGNSGASGGGLRLFSGVLGGAIGEYAVREDGTLVEVTVRRGGHDGDASVVELAWGGAMEAREQQAGAGPSGGGGAAAGLLASAGTDGRTVLWDPRQRLPALYAPRCRQDVNGVAFSPTGAAAGPLLATAGNDGVVRVYDVRQLGGCGGAAAAGGTSAAAAAPPALHRLKAHYCMVRQVAFSPYGSGPLLLASSDEQGRVLVWELGRGAPLEEGLASRPELLFAHAGHVLQVDDFSWSTALYRTLASVSGFLNPEVVEAVRSFSGAEPDLPMPTPGVLVWRPAADLLPPAPPGSTAPAAAVAPGR